LSTPGKPSGYLEVLRQRDFAIIWSGKIVSNLGDALRNVALIWLVRDLTGSTLAMGTVMLCAVLPYLVFGLFAGSVVDLADRKKIMIWSDIARGILSLAVPVLLWSGALRYWQLCLLALVMSSISTLFGPAMMASIPSVVGKEQLLGANALTSLGNQISGVAGPALGGAIVGLAGTAFAFLLDGVSFLISAATIYLARIPGVRPTEGTPPVNVREVLNGVRQGFAFVLGQPLLTGVLFVAVGLNFVLAPATILLATHVDAVWGLGAQVFGYLASINSAAMVVGTLLVGLIVARVRREILIPVAVGIMGLSFGGLVFGITLGFGVLSMVAMGLVNPMINLPLQTWLMEITPDRIRGRVFSAVDVGCQMATPVSLALCGFAADAFGTRAIFGLMMVVTVLGAFVMAGVFRKHGHEMASALAD